MVSSKDFNQPQIHTVRFLLTTYLQYTVDIVELRYFVLQETKTSCQETRLHLRIMHIQVFARIIFAVRIWSLLTFVKNGIIIISLIITMAWTVMFVYMLQDSTSRLTVLKHLTLN